MNDFQIDARKWQFLNNPETYANSAQGIAAGIKPEPLQRQFITVKEILKRFQDGRGVLLADDVGLGKTTVGALVAWVLACQGKRVRIYAPNDVLRRRWAEELERHVPMLTKIGASYECIKQGDIRNLRSGRIQITTHHALIKSHNNGEMRTACDLMIIDEAHRAKGDGSAFNEALRTLGGQASRKLILTATPFSIRLTELEQLLGFVGAPEFDVVRHYANDVKRLYTLGEGHDAVTESKRLVNAAKAATAELQPYVIRHGIDDLSPAEKEHFGAVGATPWNIATPPATEEEILLLLRMDRLLKLTPERHGQRRNDPRFHIGWQHLETELGRASERCNSDSKSDPVALHHIEEAKKSLTDRRKQPHPKIAAVIEAIRPVLNGNEKVLIFCHHRATAAELLTELEKSLEDKNITTGGPEEDVWRAAWKSALTPMDETDQALLEPIIDWLCSPGVCRQVSKWLGQPARNAKQLAKQLREIQPRKAASGVPTITEAAQTLVNNLLDEQSTSTRALLKNIAKGVPSFQGKNSHWPGQLDAGLPVMGAWDHDEGTPRPSTLYTGKPDIVLALFNSPFGPDVLVTTDRLSEGVDLHRCCRHLIHYELDASPVRTLQRNGRIRRVGSWAALTKQPICYAYPTFQGTRDEKAVDIMRQRINAFGLLLGGVPALDDNTSGQGFAEAVLRRARNELEQINRGLCAEQH